MVLKYNISDVVVKVRNWNKWSGLQTYSVLNIQKEDKMSEDGKQVY